MKPKTLGRKKLEYWLERTFQMELDIILQNIPREVDWDDIPEFERMDDRVSMVSMICSNIIGVNEGYIEWCPNDEPPIEAEILAWIWVIRPDLGEKIFPRANEDLRQTILDYMETDEY
jgi:hypothetical protein